MKNTRSIRVLSVILSLLMVIGVIALNKGTVLAATDATTGLEYTIEGGQATITAFTAPAGFGGALNIPSTLGGAPVTGIGEIAFISTSSLKSVVIPSGVTSIGSAAFLSCENLTSVTIPSTVTSIGEQAFDSCIKLTGVIIPNGVISIGAWAFWGCSALTGITIPNSVTDIGWE
ncbi:MAG: leucine-rich repeat domain-containing protein, partial [Oscillospiraceae bacterium]|nr:leucine-rich repeat domain-containing protein [Oscillospiraceae bacterium]